ncbi:MAG TPA: arsenic transporter [Alcanivoracaceae bacterium]|nr:arsenic transporter [Alcanivoracaceae bacterium]
MLLASLIFIFTLVLVIWQPKGLSIGWSATLGAALSLLAGTVALSDVVIVWDIVWNATATFIAIIIISLLLDEAGFFEWAALHIARWPQGNGHALFVLIVLLGAAVAAIFANDGAALTLTPIVMVLLLRLGFTSAATLAFVMAAGFIADSASLPLVISNLVNIVSADFFNIGFTDYARVMVPVTLVSIISSIAVLWWYFRNDIPARYPLEALAEPASAIKDPVTFKTGWGVIVALLVAFFGLSHTAVPISAIAAIGAVVLLFVAHRQKIIHTPSVLKNAPWQVVIFSLGLYLVVYGLRNAGLTAYLTSVLNLLAEQGVFVATVGTGVMSALLSSVMNNMPTVLVSALSIDAASASAEIKEAMVYANVVGSDLGPKLTPIGSLATLLWLHVLHQKGLKISWGYYFKVGVVLTLPVLLTTLAALALVLS